MTGALLTVYEAAPVSPLLGRKLSDDADFVGIDGQLIGGGGDPNRIGAVGDGNRATKQAIAAARRHYLEMPWRDLERVDGGYYADKGSGTLYVQVPGSPLHTERPGEQPVACFTVDQAGGQLLFLQRPPAGPATIAQLEEEQAQQAARAREVEQEREAWLAKQPQQVLTLNDLHGPDRFPTLKEAARRIAEVGGHVERGELGELRVTVPSRIVRPGEPGDWSAGIAEKEARRATAVAAEVLALGEKVVLQALDQANERKPLHELLPDVVPAIGGGA